MTAVVASLAGSTLGRYRLVEKLGQGGMATVYRAEDPTLGREVAIKVMHPFIAERSEAGSRFEREAKAVAGLRHPNVLALHDYAPAATDQPAYLVMELLSGPSLQRFLADHGAPLGEIAAMLGLRIAQALGAAHARGVVHRDVKPENVMFDVAHAGAPAHDGQPMGSAPQVRVVLCDFGIARVAAAEGVTATGAVLGSPAYMSPEQASGHEIDARSDQFSLGALLYQLATGALPFSGTSPLVTMAKIVRGEHAPPSTKNPRVPPYLERVIERLLRVDPAARFASVDACAEALRDGLASDGFGDVDGEIAAYLRDPAGYNGAAEGRIVTAALEQAARALGRGEKARALAAANRVLSWQPDNARALELGAGLRPRPWRRATGGMVAALLLVAGAGWWRLRVREVTMPPSVTQPSVTQPSVTQPSVAQPSPATSPASSPSSSPAPPSTAPSLPSSGSATPAIDRGPLPPSSTAAHAGKRPGASRAPPSTTAPTEPSGEAVAVAAPATVSPPPAMAADTPATLVVAIAPWCDLAVDGQPHGRTPQTLRLPAGPHHVTCVNPVSGHRITRDLELAGGERRELRERLYATVRLQPRLRRGDAFAVDGGAPSLAALEVEPGRRRVTLYQAGAELETRWLDVPPAGCILVDAPRLACERP